MTFVDMPQHHPAGTMNGAAPGAWPPRAVDVVAPIHLPPSLACLADPARLAETRRIYETTTIPARRIAEGLGVRSDAFIRLAHRLGWSRPHGAPRSKNLVNGRLRLAADFRDAVGVQERILRAIDRQIRKIESRLRKPHEPIEEKDARILATLAKTMQTLMALDRDDEAHNRKAEPPDSELRADLAPYCGMGC